MDRGLKHKIVVEFAWLAGLLLISAVLEYAFILMFDLHPILSIKIQVIIGLTIVGYGVRMTARMVDYSAD